MRGWKLLACVGLVASLSGCGSIQTMMGVEPIGTAAAQVPVVNSDSFCLLAQPIPWKSTDDPVTTEAVREHNAIGKRICGWQGHPVSPPSTKP